MRFISERWRGILWIGTTYFYFLIFAQFALLHRISSIIGDSGQDGILGTMALAGVVGAAFAGVCFRPEASQRWLAGSLLGCSVGAVLALLASSPLLFMFSTAVSGISLAILTVILIGVLKASYPAKGAGLMCGLGTGMAYLVCNIPVIFNSSAEWQCGLASVACLLAILVRPGLGEAAVSCSTQEDGNSRRALLGTVIIFVVLIWADSAAFAHIQDNPSLKEASWSGGTNLWLLGLTHLAGGLLGGLIMDSGRDRLLYPLALAGLGVGWALLLYGLGGIVGPLVYAVSVSLYSTALVSFALVFEAKYRVVLRAAFVFAIGGWISSAMGIGMASDLGGVPKIFWLVAGLLLVAGLFIKGREDMSWA